jgi:hypothetical protein
MATPAAIKEPVCSFLEDTMSRTTSIKANKCLPPPFGCGKKASFNNDLDGHENKQEYKISGLCAKCQKKQFSFRRKTK